MTRRTAVKKKDKDVLTRWSINDSIETYGISNWGHDLFSVNEQGHISLQAPQGKHSIDIKELVDEIHLRGLNLPVLIRFTDILKRRLNEVGSAFDKVIREYNYTGNYRPVYPIKVNQHRHIIEDILTFGRSHHFGLECGSKAELLVAIAMMDDPEALIICNGFKDQDYIDIALTAQRLGIRVFIVVEKLAELSIILERAKALHLKPLIGLRMKLASRGRGMWEASGGARSKFGLQPSEIIQAIKILRKKQMLSQFQLLHFHIGSQITDIQPIKTALREAANIFAEVCRLGAPVGFLDVGGGLAVDYDGSHTNFASSANYNIAEYAADVIDAISNICEQSNLPHPTIITEAGRALVAHHSVLVIEALATGDDSEITVPHIKITKKTPEVLKRMADIYYGFTGKNFQETYHDAIEARREALMLFNLRHLSLEDRATSEDLFWQTCRKIMNYVQQLEYVPDELDGLERLLATTYFCNFSLFQSLPDHWAIKQLFPVVPLHRLNEKPTQQAIIADVTCDSDGVIDRFVDLKDIKNTLSLHTLTPNEPYYLGVFLVGAYQEILGDLHNLFGDTNVVHVSSSANGYSINKTVEGERVEDVLEYVQFRPKDLLICFRHRVEDALQKGTLPLDLSAAFLQKVEEGLNRYTYLRSETSKKTKPSTPKQGS